MISKGFVPILSLTAFLVIASLALPPMTASAFTSLRPPVYQPIVDYFADFRAFSMIAFGSIFFIILIGMIAVVDLVIQKIKKPPPRLSFLPRWSLILGCLSILSLFGLMGKDAFIQYQHLPQGTPYFVFIWSVYLLVPGSVLAFLAIIFGIVGYIRSRESAAILGIFFGIFMFIVFWLALTSGATVLPPPPLVTF